MGEIARSAAVRQVSVVTRSVSEQQLQRLRAMTGEEKIRAAEALRAAAWELKAAWIRSQHPDFSEEDVQDAVRRWFSASTP
jgi:hypothetical protein